MQSQLVCNGCRNVLLYPRGATNVCCAVCSTITPVTSPGDMAQLVCGGCRTLLMYSRGAASVRCSCCNMVNSAVRTGTANAVAHVNCAQCHTTLMYPYGAPSVKCAICHFVTNIMNSIRIPPTQAPPTSSAPAPQAQNVTVVVENPMSVDESGKLVSNVVVGVTTGKK